MFRWSRFLKGALIWQLRSRKPLLLPTYERLKCVNLRFPSLRKTMLAQSPPTNSCSCTRISRRRFTDTIMVHARLASEIFFEQPDHLRIDAHFVFAYFTQSYANCLR